VVDAAEHDPAALAASIRPGVVARHEADPGEDPAVRKGYSGDGAGGGDRRRTVAAAASRRDGRTD
jgi:hypothetical protein